MKMLAHKFISVVMAVVVLLSTMSFSVDMHYCGDMLVDFSIMEQVKTCGMEKVKTGFCGYIYVFLYQSFSRN